MVMKGPATAAVGGTRTALDWLLDAYKALPNTSISFVCGFRHQALMRQYPEVNFVFNPAWRSTGPLHSLALVPIDEKATLFVTYGDVVYRDDVLLEVLEHPADLVAAVDTQWRTRYDQRNPLDLVHAEKVRMDGEFIQSIGADVPLKDADAEFAGLFKCKPNTCLPLRASQKR